ncbi:MAG TPA: DUF4962 domain-containing protein, partial [Tepidisphaeraceae bacterium]|nr:DUF4962 domain-containing protein [Tepidisphaeraceae bacterium]
MKKLLVLLTLFVALSIHALDESPIVEGEWGFRPDSGSISSLNPPRFAWRPQNGASSYDVQASQDASFARIDYEAESIVFNVHAPAEEFASGDWAWRFRAIDSTGKASPWSGIRKFAIPDDAVKFPSPPRDELLARIPKDHPRLFVRPEQMPALREKARGELKPIFDAMKKQGDAWVKSPPIVNEPPLYPPGTESHSEQWRTYWHGAWDVAIAKLDPAAKLGFLYQVTQDKRYGQLAVKMLMEAAVWDPKGSTGYLYNDEAGMPYNYLFSRTYTFVHDLLTKDQRTKCCDVMRIRGKEMYHHLCPDHLWHPYKSHQNRAWHFLGEVAIAFHGEIPEADDWLWFAMNVFENVYPAWNDSDGGWHEGLAYWRSYMERFSWWADVMKSAMDIDAYRMPFFSQIGYYPMYVQPPGLTMGGFGDQTTTLKSSGNTRLMSVFARQAQNPYWQWYVDAHGQGAGEERDYIGFVRAANYRSVAAKPPSELPSSRVFRGVGQAYLHSDLSSAKNDVELMFKSSPMGTQSHGYDSQNAFMLFAFGEPIFISSGQRDIYGSDHHANWMWETKSVNSITVGGKGQIKHSPAARGKIAEFSTSGKFDFVRGEAGAAYGPSVKRFTRSILFVKPELIVMFDQLESAKPQTFQWWLHSPNVMTIDEQEIRASNKTAACRVDLLWPAALKITQTDKFDPPPRERIKLTQYHLTAATTQPATSQQFVSVFRPHRSGQVPSGDFSIEESAGEFVLDGKLSD